MHIDFDPFQVDWTFFALPRERLDGGDGAHGAADGQSGAGAPVIMSGNGGGGGSIGAYPMFTGMAFQRGAGLGSVFRSLYRFLLPIGQQMGKAIGRQGLETGSRVLAGLLDGKDVKETLTTEGKAGLKNLLEKAADNLGRQKGQGGSFDFKRYKRTIGDPVSKNAASTTTKGIKRILHSNIGPPDSLPISSITRRRKTTTTTTKRKTPFTDGFTRKSRRIDALGPY